MDWNAAIEKNREALKRVLAMLVAMTGLGEQSAFLLQDGALPQGLALAEKPSPALTLPRRLHRAVLTLLRPAEAAVRRLVIVAARGLVVALPPPRKPRPKRVATEPLLRSLGIAVTVSAADVARIAAARRAAAERAARPRGLSLPLFDLLPGWGGRARPVARGVPRISVPGLIDRFPIPAPLSARDPIDARRLLLRLQTLGRVLDNLPREAKRFARWRAARDAAHAQSKESPGAAGVQSKKTRRRFRRIWPLKPGHPPGWRRKPDHEVHEILNVTHGLAIWAMEDTS